jgi:hypothetical protein
MENNEKILKSCSFASDDYSVPGHLFLVNNWEERNPAPHSGVLTLRKDYNECETISDNV